MSTPTSVEQLLARVAHLEERNAALEAEDAARRQAWEQQSPAKVQLELLLAHAPVILWAADAAGRITRLRGRGLAWLGLDDGALFGRAAADLFAAAPEAIGNLERALRGDEFAARVRLRDVFLDCHYVPIRNVVGDVTGVQGVGVIATAGELARMCFATSQALLAQTSPAGPGGPGGPAVFGTAVFRAGSMELIEAGEPLLDLFGLDREAAIGRRLDELWTWSDPQAAERFRVCLREVGRCEQADCAVRTLDGRDLSIRLTAEVLGWDGADCVWITVEDQTERRAALAALRQRQERLGIWLQRAERGTDPNRPDDERNWLAFPEAAPTTDAASLPESVACSLTLDARGTITDLSRAPRGVRPSDLVGHSVFDFLPPSEHAAARWILDAAAAGGASTRREFAVLRRPRAASGAPGGEPARLLCHVGPRRFNGSAGGHAVGHDRSAGGAVVVATDVTVRRLREAVARRRRLRYEQTVRLMLLGEMAGIVAHKVNNPLAAITNFARGCVRRLRQADDDGGMRLLIEALDEITEQANRASLSLRQIRNFLQPRDTAYRQVSPMAVVRRAVQMVEPLARSRGVRVLVTGTRPLPTIGVDPLRIEQVLVHLLLNGIEAVAPEFPADSAMTAGLLARSVQLADDDATPPLSAVIPPAEFPTAEFPTARTLAERVVSVSVAARGGGTVEFTVADNGPGVPASLHELIFEPFFTTRPKGLGMGLALSRSIIESHRGRLWIECPETPAGPAAVPAADAGREAGSGEPSVADRGGTVFRFTLPGREESASHE